MTAIIGLGSMGLGMARNIVAAGLDLRGYDLAESSRAALADIGGTPTHSALDAARGCPLLLLMVVNAEQAHSVLCTDGVMDALQPNATVVLCSTVAPSEARTLGAMVAKAGHMLLDAPVSGGKVGADAGTLTVMVAGATAALDRARPVLQAISKKVHHLGDEPGIASTYKAVHQLAAGVHLVVAAELMALGVKAGCDPERLYEIVSSSAGQSWMFNDRVPRMLEGDTTPRSMVDIFIKDLGIVLQTGQEAGASLPLAAAARQMLLAASAMGHGKADDSAVIKVYEALSGNRTP